MRAWENTLANALIVAHYLGPLRKARVGRFPRHSPGDILLMAERLMGSWPSLVGSGPHLSSPPRGISGIVHFLKKKLHAERPGGFYYTFLNKLFYILKELSFSESREYNIAAVYGEWAARDGGNVHDFSRALRELEPPKFLDVATNLGPYAGG